MAALTADPSVLAKRTLIKQSMPPPRIMLLIFGEVILMTLQRDSIYGHVGINELANAQVFTSWTDQCKYTINAYISSSLVDFLSCCTHQTETPLFILIASTNHIALLDTKMKIMNGFDCDSGFERIITSLFWSIHWRQENKVKTRSQELTKCSLKHISCQTHTSFAALWWWHQLALSHLGKTLSVQSEQEPEFT